MAVIGSYTAQWGPLRLYLDDLDTAGGRDQVVHDPARGDGYVIQDRGRVLRRVRCTLVFSEIASEAKSARARYDEFLALVDGGDEHVFVHPLHGSFLAVVGEYNESLSVEADVIRISAEFIPSDPFEPVSDVGAGVVPLAGPEAVQGVGDELATALGTEGADDDPLADLDEDDAADLRALPDDCVTLAESWSDAEVVDSRRVFLELSTKVDEIDALVEATGLDSLETWDAYRAAMTLRAKLVDAADAVATEESQTFDYVVRAPVPLLTLCARLYGASRAGERASQVAVSNDLRFSYLLPAGLVLKMPTEGASR